MKKKINPFVGNYKKEAVIKIIYHLYFWKRNQEPSFLQAFNKNSQQSGPAGQDRETLKGFHLLWSCNGFGSTSTQPALLMNNQLSYSTTQLLFQDLSLLPHLWATLPHHHPHVTRKSDFFPQSVRHLCCLVATGRSHQPGDRCPDAVQISADTSWSTGGWLSVRQSPASCALGKYPIDNALGSHLLAFRN